MLLVLPNETAGFLYKDKSTLYEAFKSVVKVLAKDIQPLITAYNGITDVEIERLVKNAKLNYMSYLFEDGRILLVLPHNMGAFLYKDKETLFAALSLESTKCRLLMT